MLAPVYVGAFTNSFPAFCDAPSASSLRAVAGDVAASIGMASPATFTGRPLLLTATLFLGPLAMTVARVSRALAACHAASRPCPLRCTPRRAPPGWGGGGSSTASPALCGERRPAPRAACACVLTCTHANAMRPVLWQGLDRWDYYLRLREHLIRTASGLGGMLRVEYTALISAFRPSWCPLRARHACRLPPVHHERRDAAPPTEL